MECAFPISPPEVIDHEAYGMIMGDSISLSILQRERNVRIFTLAPYFGANWDPDPVNDMGWQPDKQASGFKDEGLWRAASKNGGAVYHMDIPGIWTGDPLLNTKAGKYFFINLKDLHLL